MSWTVLGWSPARPEDGAWTLSSGELSSWPQAQISLGKEEGKEAGSREQPGQGWEGLLSVPRTSAGTPLLGVEMSFGSWSRGSGRWLGGVRWEASPGRSLLGGAGPLPHPCPPRNSVGVGLQMCLALAPGRNAAARGVRGEELGERGPRAPLPIQDPDLSPRVRTFAPPWLRLPQSPHWKPQCLVSETMTGKSLSSCAHSVIQQMLAEHPCGPEAPAGSVCAQ